MLWSKLDVMGPECEISTGGVVRQKRKIIRGKELTDVIRKPYTAPNGRLFIAFNEGGKQQNKYVHILLAQTYVANPLEHKHVICEDYSAPTVKNVHWVNAEELPKRPYVRRVVKLTAEDVADIKELLEDGAVPQKRIALSFGVTPSMISKIKKCR